MGAEEKNGKEILSQIVADLFAVSKGGEDPSAKIHLLREEIKKVIENADTIFGKFHGVAESFREIIPQEMQRYNAAIKALLATSKISRQEIVKAINTQLEELKILEKVLLSTHSGTRDEFTVREARLREIRDEISKLREQTGRLESEEKEILTGMASREKEVEPAEKAVRELFADIAAEISYIKKRVEEPTSGERPVFQPVPPPGDPVKNAVPAEKTKGGGQESKMPASPAPRQDAGPQNTESQKKCPMCGGRMDLQIDGRTWLCYSCAYQELKGEAGGSEQKSDVRVPSAQQQDTGPQETGSQKKCPMCGGRMDLQIDGRTWLCYSCAYEESDKGGAQQPKSEEKSEFTNPPPAVSSASPSSNEHQDPIKGLIGGSSPSKKQPSTKRKACPACAGNMKWLETEKAWRCPFCGYERRI